MHHLGRPGADVRPAPAPGVTGRVLFLPGSGRGSASLPLAGYGAAGRRHLYSCRGRLSAAGAGPNCVAGLAVAPPLSLERDPALCPWRGGGRRLFPDRQVRPAGSSGDIAGNTPLPGNWGPIIAEWAGTICTDLYPDLPPTLHRAGGRRSSLPLLAVAQSSSGQAGSPFGA